MAQTLVNRVYYTINLASERETPTNAYSIRSGATITIHAFSLRIFSKSWQYYFNAKRRVALVNLAPKIKLIKWKYTQFNLLFKFCLFWTILNACLFFDHICPLKLRPLHAYAHLHTLRSHAHTSTCNQQLVHRTRSRTTDLVFHSNVHHNI